MHACETSLHLASPETATFLREKYKATLVVLKEGLSRVSTLSTREVDGAVDHLRVKSVSCGPKRRTMGQKSRYHLQTRARDGRSATSLVLCKLYGRQVRRMAWLTDFE